MPYVVESPERFAAEEESLEISMFGSENNEGTRPNGTGEGGKTKSPTRMPDSPGKRSYRAGKSMSTPGSPVSPSRSQKAPLDDNNPDAGNDTVDASAAVALGESAATVGDFDEDALEKGEIHPEEDVTVDDSEEFEEGGPRGAAAKLCRWLLRNKDQFIAGITVGNVWDKSKNELHFSPFDVCHQSIMLIAYHIFAVIGFIHINACAVALGQVPEVISYALIAGVNPLLALQSTWIMGILTSIIGGRPGMISGATAAVAIALINLVQQFGTEYIFYAIMFAGLLQIAFAALRLGELLRFVPYPIMVGFVNTMALIIIFAQLKFFKQPSESGGEGRTFEVSHHSNYYQVLLGTSPWVNNFTLAVMLIEAAFSFLICLILPKITRMIPSAFVAIVTISVVEWAILQQVGYPTTLIQDYATVEPTLLKPPFIDNSYNMPPLNWDTFQKVWSTGLAVFFVSTVESLLTFRRVGEKTDKGGSVHRMALGQGIANIVSPVLGGMGGGAMLAQSVINNKSGGDTKLSGFVAGVTLLILMSGAYPAVGVLPVAAFAGVMLYAAYCLTEWTAFITILASFFPQQLRDLLYLDCKVNRSDTVIMLVVTVMTFFLDTAMAVIVGSALAVYAYCWDWSNRLEIDREYDEEEETVTYRIKGPLFFATAHFLLDFFPPESIAADDAEEVILLMEDAEVFDWSGMIALKRFHDLISSYGKSVALSTISSSTKKLMEKSSSMWEGVVFLELQELEEDEEGDGSQLLEKPAGEQIQEMPTDGEKDEFQ